MPKSLPVPIVPTSSPHPKPELRLDFASHAATKFACEHWHYAFIIPRSRLVSFGVWEDGIFIGCVVFGMGANYNMASPFGLRPHEVVELVRIALTTHRSPVSRILSIATKLFRKHSPNVKLIVSYADTSYGHHGGIYQASGWRYIGSRKQEQFLINGVKTHKRGPAILAKNLGVRGTREFVEKHYGKLTVYHSVKHKYVYPLCDGLHLPSPLPYPKRRVEPVASDGAGTPPDEACATHSSTLHVP